MGSIHIWMGIYLHQFRARQSWIPAEWWITSYENSCKMREYVFMVLPEYSLIFQHYYCFCLHFNSAIFTFVKKNEKACMAQLSLLSFIHESLFFKASNIPFLTAFSFRNIDLISLWFSSIFYQFSNQKNRFIMF